MTRRTGASARSQALAKAQEAVARRDAERIAKEKQLQAILADFYHAQGAVERIRNEAEAAAAPFEGSIQTAVRALDGLGETRAGIAGLTGLSLLRIREYLAETISTESGPNARTAEVPVHCNSRNTTEDSYEDLPAKATAADSER